MTDKEALDILINAKIDDIEAWSEAICIAVKRLNECQWHDYIEGSYSNNYLFSFGRRMILGIRYDDGSRGTVSGHVMYDMDKGYYLEIDHEEKNYLTNNAVIEKYMKYPDYGGFKDV